MFHDISSINMFYSFDLQKQKNVPSPSPDRRHTQQRRKNQNNKLVRKTKIITVFKYLLQFENMKRKEPINYRDQHQQATLKFESSQ